MHKNQQNKPIQNAYTQKHPSFGGWPENDANMIRDILQYCCRCGQKHNWLLTLTYAPRITRSLYQSKLIFDSKSETEILLFGVVPGSIWFCMRRCIHLCLHCTREQFCVRYDKRFFLSLRKSCIIYVKCQLKNEKWAETRKMIENKID